MGTFNILGPQGPLVEPSISPVPSRPPEYAEYEDNAEYAEYAICKYAKFPFSKKNPHFPSLFFIS